MDLRDPLAPPHASLGVIEHPPTPFAAARGDEVFDRIARLVRTTLRVPTSVVAFVAHDLQVFPGAVGLPEPWQTTRCMPLEGSFAQFVVGGARPLVVNDTREEIGLLGNASVVDLGVAAYAGMPLRSAAGAVVGSLCAVDRQPRHWTPGELSLLADLAATCEGELRLREALTVSQAAGSAAERARDAATTSELAAVGQRQEAENARARSELLLELSEAMAATRDVDDVARAVARVARRGLGASLAAVALADERERTLRYLDGGLAQLPAHICAAWTTFSLDEVSGAACAARFRRPSFHEDASAFLADFPHLATEVEDSGLGAMANLPLLSSGKVVGALSLGWPQHRVMPPGERQVMAALAGYAAQALQRCLLLEAERGVAATLQRAMFTDLPTSQGMEVSARYLPAAEGHEVGGDWYDAFITPDGALTVVIGDVTGHDMEAAATMGQLRAGLRTLIVALDEAPAQSLACLDQALATLSLPATATAVLARVEQGAELAAAGLRRVRWSNAGHPPPVLLRPDGSVEVLDTDPDLLLGFFPSSPRTDHTVDLAVGSTLLLYTDGLVERRSSDLEDGTRRLVEAVRALAGAPLDVLLDEVVRTMVGGGAEDDVAVIALRTGPSEAPRLETRRARGRHSR